MSGYRARYDAGLVEDDDDPDLDPVTVKMTKGDARWLAMLIDHSWQVIPAAPRDIPLYAALRTAAGDPVPYDELGRLAVEALGGVEPMPPIGPLGDDREPPY